MDSIARGRLSMPGWAMRPSRSVRAKPPTCKGWPSLPIPLQWADAGDGGNIGLRAGDGIAFSGLRL